MNHDKTAKYQANITRSLAELYQHMEDMLDHLTDEQLEVIERVEAIEQEWILDPVIREEVSLIQWEIDS